MFAWLNKKKPVVKAMKEEIENEEIENEDLSCIGEPIFSFVAAYKANPSHFKIRNISKKDWKGAFYYWMEEDRLFQLEDIKRGLTFTFYLDNIHATTNWHMQVVELEVNGYESGYLCRHLSPLALEPLRRIRRMELMKKQREIAAKALIQTNIRSKLTKAYQ